MLTGLGDVLVVAVELVVEDKLAGFELHFRDISVLALCDLWCNEDGG